MDTREGADTATTKKRTLGAPPAAERNPSISTKTVRIGECFTTDVQIIDHPYLMIVGDREVQGGGGAGGGDAIGAGEEVAFISLSRLFREDGFLTRMSSLNVAG